MQNIIVMTDPVEHAAGGIFAITAANFPSCKLALTAAGVKSNGTIVCPISGAILSGIAAINNGDGTWSCTTGESAAISGLAYTPGTKDQLLIVTGGDGVTHNVSGTLQVEFGDSTNGPSISASASNGAFVVYDVDQYLTVADANITPWSGIGTFFDNSAADSEGYVITSTTKVITTVTDTNSTPAVTGGLTFGVFPQTIVMPNADNHRYGGIYLFALSGSTVTFAVAKQVLAWMAGNPGKICPMLKGLAG